MGERLLTIKGVEEKIGFKESKIRLMIREGRFPTGRMIQGKRLWLESEVDAWITREWAEAELAEMETA